MSNSLKAVIFDVDGTLAETEEVHRKAFNAAFADFGFDWVWDQALYKDLLKVAGGKERIRHFLNLKGHTDVLARPDIDEMIPTMHKTKTGHYERMLNNGEVELRPGVERLIKEIKAAGLKLGLATTTHKANVDVLVANTLGGAPEDWFDVLGCGEHAPTKKPAPDVYNYVLGEFGVDGADCVALEDAVIGLKAARAAGVPTVVTVSPYTDGGQFDDALIILDCLGEPDAPFEVREGDANGFDHVTLDALRAWHGRG